MTAPPGNSHTPAPDAVFFSDRTETLDFSYSWPREADAVPSLRAYLEADRKGDLRFARSEAGLKPGRYHYSNTWVAEGRAGPLRGYSALIVHGGGEQRFSVFEGLVWSTFENRLVTFNELLGLDWSTRFRERFCAKLMSASAAAPRGLARACPDLAPLTPMPRDYSRDGRFDTIDLLFEGWSPGETHRISIPLTAADVGALPPRYRSRFRSR